MKVHWRNGALLLEPETRAGHEALIVVEENLHLTAVNNILVGNMDKSVLRKIGTEQECHEDKGS